MSFNFVIPEMNIGGNGNSPFVFYKRGFVLGNGTSPSWQDIILSGNTALTLTNALANSLNYVKLFGGTEQRNLPNGFTQVEYIESSGTQWIDTGYKPTIDGYKAKLKFKLTSTLISQDIIGFNYLYNNIRQRKSLGLNTSGKTIFGFGKGDSGYATVSDLSLNTLYENEYVFVNPCSYTINGESGTQTYTGYVDDTDNIYLIAINTHAEVRGTIGKWYYCQLWDNNGILVRNLIPCKRNSDNVLGMYDTVTGNFLTNAGTGTFTAGADVTTPSPDTPMDIVCNNGAIKVSKNLYNSATRTDGYYIGADGVIAQGSGTFCYSALIPVKPNTDYMLSGMAGQSDNRRLHAYDSNGNWISQISFANTTTGYTYNITGTTPNNCVYVRISIPMLDTNVQLEQGSTATPYHPYGIYADGTTETVQVTGKNLYNDATKVEGYYINSGGTIEENVNFSYSALIPVVEGSVYTWSGTSTRTSSTNKRCHGFNSNGEWVQQIDYINIGRGNYSLSVTIPSGVAYIRISGMRIKDYPDTNVQVEQGSTATTYEEYFNGGSATCEDLLSVDNFTDVQSILDGIVTKKVGVHVLDGTENWTRGVAIYADIPAQNVFFGYKTCLCTHYKGVNNTQQGSALVGTYCVCIGSNANGEEYKNRMYFYPAAADFTTATEWSAWLAQQYNAGTPVIIVYPLATATTETVTGQELTIQAGTNIVEITQASMDDLELEVKYKATV